ncbi:MAG: Glucosyltransferase 3 [Mycoplasmataceae bacterium]|nr:MAG: Glucosyltransferase 3 [Mycoplasmataceae bacterium]
MLTELKALNYKVSWNILNASDFGVPQNRKRIYIAGHIEKYVDLTKFKVKKTTIGSIVINDETSVKIYLLLILYCNFIQRNNLLGNL